MIKRGKRILMDSDGYKCGDKHREAEREEMKTWWTSLMMRILIVDTLVRLLLVSPSWGGGLTQVVLSPAVLSSLGHHVAELLEVELFVPRLIKPFESGLHLHKNCSRFLNNYNFLPESCSSFCKLLGIPKIMNCEQT